MKNPDWIEKVYGDYPKDILSKVEDTLYSNELDDMFKPIYFEWSRRRGQMLRKQKELKCQNTKS